MAKSEPVGCSVLIVGNFLSSHMVSRQVCEDLAERLSGAGWRVLTTSAKRNRVASVLDKVNTACRRRREYEVAQVDVFSGRAFLWAEAACWTLRRARKPYILTLHGGNLPRFARRWPRRVVGLLRSAAAVTAPSRYLHEQLREYRGDILLLPNPLDLSRYTYRCRLIPEPKLVWLRAFDATYNPALAVRVAVNLVRELPRLELHMAGPDKDRHTMAEVKDLARNAGIGERLFVYPGVPKTDVPQWLQRGGIFLNTTNADNTPVSVLEAMACGLCVVSTNVGGLPYLLEDGANALLVPPRDSVALADALRRILVEPDLRRGLIARGRALAQQNTLDTRVAEMAGVLKESIQTNRSGLSSLTQVANRCSH